MRSIKRIAVFLTAIMLFAGVSLLSACGEEKTPGPSTPGTTTPGGTTTGIKNPVTYKLTVVYSEEDGGAPIEGVKVTLTKDSETYGPYTTDAQGVVSVTLEKGTYTASFDRDSFPQGYYADSFKITATLPTREVRAKKSAFEPGGSSGGSQTGVLYTVTVVYPNGDPVEGAQIGMCKGDQCTSFGTTAADGTVSKKVESANYTVQITNINNFASYTYDKDEHNYYMKNGQVVYVTADDPNVTIVLKTA